MSVTRNFFLFPFFFHSQFAAPRWWSLASTFSFYLEYLALRTGGVGIGIPFDWCIRLFCIFCFHVSPWFGFLGIISSFMPYYYWDGEDPRGISLLIGLSEARLWTRDLRGRNI
ncbi:hypothetical protein V8C34DRAFT_252184 [Trichoderma compactum]